MKKSNLFVVAVAFCTVFFSCRGYVTVNAPSHKVSYTAGGHGTLTATVDANPFESGRLVEEGKSVDFTATPDAGYKSVWSGATQNADDPNKASVKVTKDVSVTVSFMAGENYTITYNLDGGTNDDENPATYNVESEITLKEPTKTGYTFAGWYEKSDFSGTFVTKIEKGSTGNKSFWAKWTAGTQTAYTVEHYKQNVSDDGYTIVTADTETKTGTTGSTTVAVAKTYTGFTAKDITQGTILADGTTVVKVYYDRKVVTLTFNTDGGKWADGTTVDKTASGRYEATVTPPANPTKTGYTFASWNPTLPSTMPESDTTYTAVWANSTNTPYTVEHYKQNVLDDGYTLVSADTETKTGVTGSSTVAVAKTYTGFTAKDIEQGTILVNGSTVVKVYYDRKLVTLTFNTAGGKWADGTTVDKTASGKYEAPVTPPANPSKTGYTFASWNPTLPSTMPLENATYTAKWTANKYTVAFDSNGGSGTMQSQSFTYDIAQNLSANTFTKTGFVFTGWNTQTDGTGTLYTDEASVKNLAAEPDATVTLYAKWEQITAENVASVIAGLKGEEPYKIVVTGEVTASTISAIKTALQNNSSAKVDLDLSATTGLSSLPYEAFIYCKSLSSVTIPSSVTNIGNYAFYGCKSLTSVTIPSSVTTIGNWAFEYCTSLVSVTIPSSVTSIGVSAFRYCTSLSSVTIPSTVTSIGSETFWGCHSLASVTIPSSVTSIGWNAFNGCTSLTSLVFEDTSTWYRATSSSDWYYKTGGTQTDLSEPSTNATYFKSTYSGNCWYKLD